jgi:uncharacterized repeat protein (TIGR03803 family)
MKQRSRISALSLSIVFALWFSTAIATPAQTFTTLANFKGTGGMNPGGLVQGFDGNLYGTISYDGANGAGTAFEITPRGAFTSVYAFCALPNCADGGTPTPGLVQGRDGNLYGATGIGGTTGNGNVFRMTPQGAVTPLHNFCTRANCSDGTVATPGIVQALDGAFYGTTTTSGVSNATVFKFTTSGSWTVLYRFCAQGCGPDGVFPNGLIQGTDGNFYGTTSSGLTIPATVYKITPTGTLTILHNFCDTSACTDGNDPFDTLVEAANGNFYGTTWRGGSDDAGTVFKITPQGSLTTLHSFTHCSSLPCADGNRPNVALIQATDGNFYGTTDQGGTYNRGTLFQITSGGAEKILHSFSSAGHVGQLIQATDGNLYGMKSGSTDSGSVFKLDMGLGPFIETLPTAGAAGTKVTVLGTDLTGATLVSFNGVPATFKVVSASEITARVPSGATSGTVEVTTPSGTLSSNVVFRVP